MFRGGPRFMAFQGFSWSFFAISLPLGSGIIPSHRHKETPFLGASVFSALISEVLMVSSSSRTTADTARLRGIVACPLSRPSAERHGDTCHVWACCGLALAGAAMLLTAHRSYDSPAARLVFVTLALACFAIAVPVTHGLGGRLKWALTGAWTFYQPGKGGFASSCYIVWMGLLCTRCHRCAVLASVFVRALLARGTGGDVVDGSAIEMRVVAVASWVAECRFRCTDYPRDKSVALSAARLSSSTCGSAWEGGDLGSTFPPTGMAWFPPDVACFARHSCPASDSARNHHHSADRSA